MHSTMMWAALALAAVGSCDPAQFKNPASDPAKIKSDPKLTGTWVAHDAKTEFTFFAQEREDHHVDLLLVGRSADDGVSSIAWDAFPSAIGGKTYLNLREKVFSDSFGNKYTLKPPFMLVRYELTGETLSLSYLSQEAAEADGGVPFEGDTASVAAALVKLPPKAFSHFQTFKRVKLSPVK